MKMYYIYIIDLMNNLMQLPYVLYLMINFDMLYFLYNINHLLQIFMEIYFYLYENILLFMHHLILFINLIINEQKVVFYVTIYFIYICTVEYIILHLGFIYMLRVIPIIDSSVNVLFIKCVCYYLFIFYDVFNYKSIT